jgi:high frequency lysogenization protein
LYQRTISQLDRRIHVVGSAELLQQNGVAAKIRTLLLAGVRGAWLWQQSGGRRWHLVLRRSTIRSALAELAQPTMIH